MQDQQKIQYINIWQFIPQNAFLYFPEGQQIKIGTKQSQWRKIFQLNEKFDQFQETQLQELQKKLVISNIKVHPWFDKANKLRYLQANKWKRTPTCQAIAQYSRYRYAEFPIKETPGIISMLNKGTFYLNGRDNQYRPIIMADLNKFHKNDIDLIPPTLVFLMEFMIKNLLIQGQVQNYVLIMNLQNFSMDQKSLVSKIIGFTSSSYRGRLFVSYLLGAPWILRTGWNSIASAFVSQNTLRKIKITGDLNHNDMWTHIDKNIIQKKYGGNRNDIVSNYWPPTKQNLLFQPKQAKNKLISIEQYNDKFQNMKLQKRKVLKSLIRRKTMTVRDDKKKAINLFEQLNIDPLILTKKILDSIDTSKLTDVTVLVQHTVFPQIIPSIQTFFNNKPFQKIK